MTLKGGCLCGAVSYEISGDPMFVGHCACQNCQKATGGGHSSIAAYPESQVQSRGAVSSYAGKGDSGQATNYQFCPTCGSRLFTRAAMMPGVVMVTLGTMEAGSEPEPTVFIYGKRRRAWDAVDPATPVFEGMPAPG